MMDSVQEMAMVPLWLNNTTDHEHDCTPVSVRMPTYSDNGGKEFVKKELAKLHLQSYIEALKEEQNT